MALLPLGIFITSNKNHILLKCVFTVCTHYTCERCGLDPIHQRSAREEANLRKFYLREVFRKKLLGVLRQHAPDFGRVRKFSAQVLNDGRQLDGRDAAGAADQNVLLLRLGHFKAVFLPINPFSDQSRSLKGEDFIRQRICRFVMIRQMSKRI